MKLFSAGADAIPEPQTQNQTKKKYRLITVGKKQLPKSGSKGRNSVFWASVSIVGEDLGAIQQGKIITNSTFRLKEHGTMQQIALRIVSPIRPTWVTSKMNLESAGLRLL